MILPKLTFLFLLKHLINTTEAKLNLYGNLDFDFQKVDNNRYEIDNPDNIDIEFDHDLKIIDNYDVGDTNKDADKFLEEFLEFVDENDKNNKEQEQSIQVSNKNYNNFDAKSVIFPKITPNEVENAKNTESVVNIRNKRQAISKIEIIDKNNETDITNNLNNTKLYYEFLTTTEATTTDDESNTTEDIETTTYKHVIRNNSQVDNENTNRYNSVYNFFINKLTTNNGYNLKNGTVVRGFYSTHVIIDNGNSTNNDSENKNNDKSLNVIPENSELSEDDGMKVIGIDKGNKEEINRNNDDEFAVDTIASGTDNGVLSKYVMPKNNDNNDNENIHNENEYKNNGNIEFDITNKTYIDNEKPRIKFVCILCRYIGCPDNKTWIAGYCVSDDY